MVRLFSSLQLQAACCSPYAQAAQPHRFHYLILLPCRLAVARALLRNPSIVLLDDADQFHDLMGDPALQDFLRGWLQRGTSVVVAATSTSRFPWIRRVYELRLGQLWQRGSDASD